MRDTDGQPVIRVTAMPADANAYGDIFGGWLMSLMDMGAGRSLLSYIGRFMRRARYDNPRFSRAERSFERAYEDDFSSSILWSKWSTLHPSESGVTHG